MRELSCLGLLICLFGCTPKSSSPDNTVVFSELREGSEGIEDFADTIDSVEIKRLSAAGGSAKGAIDVKEDKVDVDIIRVIATPGNRLKLTFSAGVGVGAELRPFVIVADESGEVLGLCDGSEERVARLEIVVPTRTSLFVILQDARNAKDGAEFGGAGLDYSLQMTEAVLAPAPLTANTTQTLEGGKLSLFSVAVTPGQEVSIIVDPLLVADPAFVPFITVYSSSFDLGATIAAEEPLQTIQSDITAFNDLLVFSVSDFSGGTGSGYSFDVVVIKP